MKQTGKTEAADTLFYQSLQQQLLMLQNDMATAQLSQKENGSITNANVAELQEAIKIMNEKVKALELATAPKELQWGKIKPD